jgi:lipopolysaccharide/colanic/teichoic acid biosynthesis glycosyltransferase
MDDPAITGLRSLDPPIGRRAEVVKRFLDLALTLPPLILLAPWMLLIALVIKLTSPGNALFKQTRIGKDFREFTIFKFRSMRTDTPPLAHGEALDGGDLRITPIGAFLRRTSIDEIPQLLNVVRGDMSLVGPRPLIEWESRECLVRHAARFLVKPGVTGLQQVAARNAIDLNGRSDLDVEYTQRWSLLLDISLLFRTPARLLNGEGVYESLSAEKKTV